MWQPSGWKCIFTLPFLECSEKGAGWREWSMYGGIRQIPKRKGNRLLRPFPFPVKCIEVYFVCLNMYCSAHAVLVFNKVLSCHF